MHTKRTCKAPNKIRVRGSIYVLQEPQNSEAGVLDFAKKALVGLILSIPFISDAHGSHIDNPSKAANKAEQVIKKVDDSYSVSAKETKIGTIQKVVFTLSKDGKAEHNITFIGTKNDTLNNVEWKSAKSVDPVLKEFAKTMFECLGKKKL